MCNESIEHHSNRRLHDLVVDGVSTPSLGGSGAVRRDLPLDPDLIKDGKLALTNQRASPQ